MKVVEGLFFNRVDSQGRDRAENQRHQASAAVLTCAAPAETAWNERAPPLAGIAADFAVCWFLKECVTNEKAFDFS